MKRACLIGYCLFTISVLLAGCQDPKTEGIVGLVCTIPNRGQSGLLSGISRDQHQISLADARVFLAFDEEGRQAIPGCDTKSDRAGLYFLDTTNIPDPESGSGDYYLVVQKAGYETLVRRYGIGSMSGYHRNTVILRRLAEGNTDPDLR